MLSMEIGKLCPHTHCPVKLTDHTLGLRHGLPYLNGPHRNAIKTLLNLTMNILCCHGFYHFNDHAEWIQGTHQLGQSDPNLGYSRRPSASFTDGGSVEIPEFLKKKGRSRYPRSWCIHLCTYIILLMPLSVNLNSCLGI